MLHKAHHRTVTRVYVINKGIFVMNMHVRKNTNGGENKKFGDHYSKIGNWLFLSNYPSYEALQSRRGNRH